MIAREPWSAATLLVDVRCLQDPASARSTIGRHARMLLEHAPQHLRLSGIADPQLPPLSDTDRTLLGSIRHSGYTGATMGPTGFIQLSPMTHDPLFVARLLHHPAIPAAAVVDDLPSDMECSGGKRLEQHIALRWLARYQLLLPTSAFVAQGLKAVLGISGDRVLVTGAASGPASVAGTPRHILLVNAPGEEERVACAVRVHARAGSLQAARVVLLISGGGEMQHVAWRALAATFGGAPELVQHLPDDPGGALLTSVADAMCIVLPAQMPAWPISMADLAGHAPLCLPADPDTLAHAFDHATDPAWRGAALARQSLLWPRRAASDVAERFWTAMARLLPGKPPALAGARPRVALQAPLPPAPTIVAEYVTATCAALGRLVELQVFTPTPGALRPAGAAGVQPLSALPSVSSRFDRVVSVLGDTRPHLGVLQNLLRYGGAALLHDARLLELYVRHVGLGRAERLVETELGRELKPNELWLWLAGDIPPGALALAEVANVAEPLILHSAASVADTARRYGVTAQLLPMHPSRTVPEEALTPRGRRDARARLGVRNDDVLLVSFGPVHQGSAPFDCVWALELLRSWGVKARLHFVGAAVMAMEPAWEAARDLGLAGEVVAVGSDAAVSDYLVGADVAVQLRIAGPGAVSIELVNCIAAGLPSVASCALAAAADAPDFVHTVPNHPSPVLVAEAVLAVLERGRPSTEVRKAYMASHGADAYAARLCAALDLL